MRDYLISIFFLVFTLISIQEVNAQEILKSVEGVVVDSTGLGIKGASVRLVSSLDTMSTTTDDNGFYKFNNIKGKSLNLSYSSLGYQIINKSISSTSFINKIFIPKVTLFPQSTLIPEVRILKVIPVVDRGDTIQFNMAAFSFPQYSLLEEALKQLPGFQVLRDGTTYYNGQLIRGVRVDGKKFFGGDLLTATRNLPSEFVKQIEVINDYGELSTAKGIKTNDPEKIINIILQPDKKKITFGQGTIGGGTRDRFLGSIGINKFNDGQEMSIVGSINNTNTSLFLFGSPDGAGSRNTDLSEIGDFSDPNDGLNKLGSIGISFTDNIGSRVTLNGGYTYQSKFNLTTGNSLLTSTYPTYKIHRTEEYENKTYDNLHTLNLEMNSKFKNNDILKINPKLSYNREYFYNNRKSDLLNQKNYGGFRKTIRDEGERQDSTKTSKPSADISMLYSKFFHKPGRKLVADLRLNYQSNTKDDEISESYLTIDSTGNIPVESSFRQKQFVDSRNDVSGIKSSISYVEPFYEHSLLEIMHEMDITTIEAVRVVRNPYILGGEFVDSLSMDYAYQFKSFKTGLNYQYEPNKKFRVNMGFTVQPVNLSGRVKGDTIVYDYNNVNLVPSTTIRYKFSNDLEIKLAYLGKNIQPTFLHISPFRDNTNSRSVIRGNPSLKAEFSNQFSTTLRKFVPTRGQYFQTDFAYTFIANKIVSAKVSKPQQTIQETTFENTDGYYDIKWYYEFNSPIFTDQLNLGLSGNVDYYNNLSFIDTIKNTTKQVLFNQNLQFRYLPSEYFEGVFNTNYFLNRAVYEFPFKNKIAAHSFLFSLAGRGYISDNLVLGAEMSQKFYKGYVSELSDVNPTIINTYIEYSFLKNKAALIRLQCNDIMDQNKNVGVLTSYVGNDVFESRNNRLGRYFMLTFNLRLQTYPNK